VTRGEAAQLRQSRLRADFYTMVQKTSLRFISHAETVRKRRREDLAVY